MSTDSEGEGEGVYYSRSLYCELIRRWEQMFSAVRGEGRGTGRKKGRKRREVGKHPGEQMEIEMETDRQTDRQTNRPFPASVFSAVQSIKLDRQTNGELDNC